MKRTHVTREPEALVLPLRDVEPVRGDTPFKPEGFWYEIDGAWREWCEDNMPEWTKGGLLYELDISPCKLLTLAGADAIMDFEAEYGVDVLPNNPGLIRCPDWRRLCAEGYDGVEIAPYRKWFAFGRRMIGTWYLAWDCSSGCIWNASKLIVRGPLTDGG